MAQATLRAKIALLCAFTVFALLMVEVALRLAGFSFPSLHYRDPQTGWVLRPNASGIFRIERNTMIHVSSQGLRDREHAIPKPRDTFRVAFVGDSFTMGVGVSEEHAFPRLTEAGLQTCLPGGFHKAETVNLGMDGYSTAQELLALRKNAWQFEPDAVVLAFYIGNDVRDNHKTLSGDNEIPYFYLENGKLVLDASFLQLPQLSPRRLWIQRVAGDWINRLLVLQLANWTVASRSRAAMFAHMTERERLRQSGEPILENMVYLPPVNSQWQETWALAEALIAQIASEVQAKKAKFLLVVVPTDIQVHPDPGLQAHTLARLGVPDLDYPERRLVEIAGRHGIPVLTLSEAFRRKMKEEKTHLYGFPGNPPGFGHWNEAGHALAAELIQRRLCAQLNGARPGVGTPQ